MAESDWGVGDVRSRDPALGTSPSGASEGLYGVLKTFLRSPEFISMLRSQSFVPQSPGDIKPTAAAQAPVGWLLCDGSTYQIQAYPKLWAAIGAAYGGDGVVSFKVPDLRGRAAVGAGFAGVGFTNRVRGEVGGAEGYTMTTAQMPAHNHTVTQTPHTHLGPGTAILVSGGTGNANITTGGGGYNNGSNTTQGGSANVTIDNAGGGTPFITMGPFAVVNFCIFTGV